MACIFYKVPCIFRHAGNMFPKNVYRAFDMQQDIHKKHSPPAPAQHVKKNTGTQAEAPCPVLSLKR